MHDAIKKMLEEYPRETEAQAVHALREIFQEIALLGLWRAKFFEHAAFYGGTALRVLYGLDRYSEDLDFSLLTTEKNFDLSPYLKSIKKELSGFGFAVEAELRQKRVDTPIQSAFLKADTVQSLIEISIGQEIIATVQPGRLLRIKVELDTDPPPGFDVEVKYLLRPIPFAVKTYSLPDLFAGKVHAILCRKWQNRVKGRDWYDLVWYLANHPQLHLSHLRKRMVQSGHLKESETFEKEHLENHFHQAIDNLNINQAKMDVAPFIKDQQMIEIWSKDFFRAILSNIQIV